MKAVFIIVVLVLVYLFIPHYSLYVAEDSFSDVYTLNQDGFYSEKSCTTKGEALDKRYRCERSTAWGEMVGKQRKYNSGRQID